MKNPKLLLALAALVFSSALPHQIASADTAHTVIPASPYLPIMPPPAPMDSKGGLIVRGVGMTFEVFLNWLVRDEVQRTFRAAVTKGVADAGRSGQDGVLLNVRYAENRTATNKWISGGPVGEGVSVVGIGPSPSAVCFITRCDRPSGVLLNPTAARRFTADSDYYWVAIPQKSKGARGEPVISRYRRQTLQAWTTHVTLNDAAARSFAHATNGQIVDGLARKVMEEAKTESARAEVSRILANREQARKELERIEAELATELNRQAERAKTMETLNVMSLVLKGGDLYNLAVMSKKDESTSTLTLEEQLKAGGAHIEILRNRSAQWTDKFDGTTKILLEQTVQYSVPAPRLAPTPVKPAR